MAASFQHLLLTRFNVQIFTGQGSDTAWLEHRFRFFERVCVPSVLSQTVLGFRWVLFCDAASPTWVLDRLRTSIGAAAAPVFVFIDGPETRENFRAALAPLLAPGHTHLITSRLDNDDALAVRFMETVQAQFTGQDFEFVNFPEGHTCFQGRVYALRHPSSPFLSLVERLDTPETIRTVMCEPHQEVASRYPVRQVECGPAWLQIIHGRNVCNMVRGRSRPLADLRPFHSAEVVAAAGDAAGLWGREETWRYWSRRLAKKFRRWQRPAA